MISVCMASYNGVEYIERQLRSILPQLSDGDEVIVSDDGSKDGTIAVIKGIGDNRVRVLNNQRHGIVHNFENAISNAKGDFIFLSDQDDEWLPNKVSRCLEVLKRYDCVVTDCMICDSEGSVIHNSFFEVNGTKHNKWYNLLVNNGYMGSCMAFRKNVLPHILPFPEDIPLHDIWIGNIAAFKFKICWISDKLMKYRRHGNNASNTAEKSDASLVKKLGYRWHVVKHLLFK